MFCVRESRRGRHRWRGFTLVEALVAFALLFIASIAIYAMLGVGMKATRQSGNTTEAVNLARHLIELIRVRNLPFTQDRIPPRRDTGLNDRASQRRAIDAAPFGVSDFSGLPNTSSFTRNVTMSRLSRSRRSFEYNVVRIAVKVYWNEKNVERKVEMSTLHRQP